MTNKIIQKVCGFAMSAAMALSGIAGPVADAWAEESAALAGAGAEEMVQPEEVPVEYSITLPWTEHLIIEPEEEHVFIPDPDMRTEKEKRDILLAYEAGEEVEIRIWAENNWEITELAFLDEEKEKNGYEWKDLVTVHFNMPEKNLVMKSELTQLQIAEETPQEAAQVINQGVEPSQQSEVPQAGMQPDEMQQAGIQSAEMQGDTADPLAAPGTGPAESSTPVSGNGAGTQQENSSPNNPVQGDQQPSEAGMGSEAEGSTDVENSTAMETEPAVTYIPEKEADGLPVQGSIEQTQTLEIVLNDAGFDAKIDLRNVPYDPEQYSIEYISDDIDIANTGTYSSIYKVTDPASGKFFFVLRPVKVAEEQDLSASPEQKNVESATAETTENSTESTTGTSVESEASSETASSELEAAAETEPAAETETETETEQSSGEYQVTLTEGEDLGVKLDHEDGTYNAGETVTFTMDDPQNTLIAAAALKDESNRTQDTADILYSEVSYNEGQDSFSFEMPAENVSLAVKRDQELGSGIMLLAAAADDDDEAWDDQTDVEAGSYYYFSDGKTHPFSSDMGSGGNDSYKYVRYKVDGVTYTVNAYCMQHSKTAPPSGHTYTNMTELDEGGDDVYLRKAIFYGYGGPGWGGTFGGYNIKKIMKELPV